MAKSSSKKKSTAKKKSASKAKSSPKAKKTTTAKGAANSKAKAGKAPPKKGQKKVSMSDLLLKKFDDWQPETLYAPPKEDRGDYTAPPIADGESADAVRALLMKRFDLEAAPAEKPAPKKKAAAPKKKAAEKAPPAPKKAPVSITALLVRKFEEWTPETPYAPSVEKPDIPPAPPIAAGADAERVKALLLKPIDLSDVPEPSVQPSEPEPDPEPAAPAAEPAPPREPVPIGELIRRRFDHWRPETLYAPPETSADLPAAPPIAAGPDAERIKALLLRPIDLTDVPPAPEPEPAAPAEPETADAAGVEEAQPETTPEPEPAQAETEAAPAVPEAAETVAPESATVADDAAVEEVQPETAPAEESAMAAAEADPAAEMRDTASRVIRPDPVYRPEAGWAAAGETEAESSKAQVPPIPPQKKGSDPMARSMKFLAACAIILFAIIVAASFSNASKYYLRSTDDGLEIWKGSFGPMGKERVVRLEGVAAPASMQGVYEADQVLPIAFNYYMDKAEAALYSEGVADGETVQKYINKALQYADAKNARRAFALQKNMKILSLMTMADVAASKGAPDGYKKAVALLEEAARMDSNDLIDMGRTRQAPIIEKKIAAYKGLLEAGTPETEAAKTE